METMNYLKMLENANVVKALANKTIECSKDYTDVKSDDILDQIAQYIANTINDVLHDPICQDITFRSHASGGGLSFSNYGGDGSGAQAQFFFSDQGTILRLYFNAIGYWWANKEVTDNGLKNLIKNWPCAKQQMNDAIQRGINRCNERLSTQLSRQLELHEMVKNFKI